MLALLNRIIIFYRQLYRQKTSPLPSADDALGLRGGYRRKLEACFKPIRSPAHPLRSSVSLRQATASASPRKA